ncbi:winged helix-turn-helix domain-containing protein [Streptomyces sp. NPDC001667]
MAEVFQVAERSVGTWWRAYQACGREALAVRRMSRPGPLERIGPEERAVLFQAMADYTPEELLIGGPLWTRPLVAELVRMVTGVVMTERGVGKWLRRHGFSPQPVTSRATPPVPSVGWTCSSRGRTVRPASSRVPTTTTPSPPSPWSTRSRPRAATGRTPAPSPPATSPAAARTASRCAGPAASFRRTPTSTRTASTTRRLSPTATPGSAPA